MRQVPKVSSVYKPVGNIVDHSRCPVWRGVLYEEVTLWHTTLMFP